MIPTQGLMLVNTAAAGAEFSLPDFPPITANMWGWWEPTQVFSNAEGTLPVGVNQEPIVLWKDSSGNGRDLKPVVGKNPPELGNASLNGINSPFFTRASLNMLATENVENVPDPFTVYSVVRSEQNTSNANYTWLSWRFNEGTSVTNVGVLGGSGLNGRFFIQVGDATKSITNRDNVSLSLSTWYQLSVGTTVASKSPYLRRNGVVRTSYWFGSVPSTFGDGRFSIGGCITDNGRHIQGYVMETIIYADGHDAAQNALVEEYLNNKYSIY